jgi:uncharacterized protein (DUF2141 family)
MDLRLGREAGTQSVTRKKPPVLPGSWFRVVRPFRLVTMFVKSKAGKATCLFKDVKPGEYAISIIHDEDRDSELKTSMVGRPKEWWGVSNNTPPERFGPPRDEAATFHYTGAAKGVKVKLTL